MLHSDRAMVEYLKRAYPAGTRIELVNMYDLYRPIAAGTQGTVRIVDDMGTIHVDWGNGRRLGLIVGEDSFEVISKPDE